MTMPDNQSPSLNLDLVEEITCRFELEWNVRIGDEILVGGNPFILDALQLRGMPEQPYVKAFLIREKSKS